MFTLPALSHRLKSSATSSRPKERYIFLAKNVAAIVFVLGVTCLTSRYFGSSVKPDIGSLNNHYDESFASKSSKEQNARLSAAIRCHDATGLESHALVACIFIIICQLLQIRVMKTAKLSYKKIFEDSLRLAKFEISSLQSTNKLLEVALRHEESESANLKSAQRLKDAVCDKIDCPEASCFEMECEARKIKVRVADAESEISIRKDSKLEMAEALEQVKTQAAVIQEKETDDANRREFELERANLETVQARTWSGTQASAVKAWAAAARGGLDEVRQHMQAGAAVCGTMKPQLELELRELKQIQDGTPMIQQRSADPREWSAPDVKDFLGCTFSNALNTCEVTGATFTRDLKIMLAAWSGCSSVQTLQTVIAEVEQMVFEADLMKGRFQGFEGRVIKESEVDMEAIPFASGGLADVYSAVWRKKKVAVKVLRGLSANEGSKDQLKTLVKEMDLTRKVAASEFVVKSHGVMVGTKCGIVMDEEFCSLHDAISKKALGDIRSKLKMLLDIAKGLRGIHNADVIHGDLKPSNVLMGSDGTMKIADFGSSVMYTTENTTTNHDVADYENAAGTFQFMAPEGWKGNRSKGGDIWAYGIILWQIITESVRVWDDCNQYQIWCKVVTEKNIPDLPSNANDDIKGLYVNCCQYEPERRPRADEVISTLEKMLQGLRVRDEYPWPLAPGVDKYHVKVIELPHDSNEFQSVAKLFNKTCSKVVRKVGRVQNAEQWNLFSEKQCAMESKNGSIGANLRSLFHGTRPEVIQMINHQSFNRSHCGHNIAPYGRGTYFARDAVYSSDTRFSPPDQHGLRYMYLARVLIGTFAIGDGKMKEPPLMPGQDMRRYDATTNSLSDPTKFVVYHDAQAYPEYIITFE